MRDMTKSQFFDAIASKWDSWEDLIALHEKLAAGFQKMGIEPGEMILDVGCGTGNLTKTLLSSLGNDGRVVAVDVSPAMLEEAKRKVTDPRVIWHLSDACSVPEKDGTFDRIICYSVWPHFDTIDTVIAELRRLVRSRGHLHVWHLSSREKINQTHAAAGLPVRNDVLAPAEETAGLLRQHDFEITELVDDEEQYLVSARKMSRKESAS